MEKLNISNILLLKRVINHLSKARKKQLFFIFGISLLSILAESFSIALLIPFMSFFVSPETYAFHNFYKNFFIFFNINSEEEILRFISFLFVSMIILSGIIRIYYIKFSNKLSFRVASDFRIKIFNFLLNQNYIYFYNYGSQEIMSNYAQKIGSFTTIIFSSINIINYFLVSLSIICLLIYNEPFYTPIIIISIISFFFIIFKIKSKSVLTKGMAVNLNQNKIIDVFENTVGYLPEILIYNLKYFFSLLAKNLSENIAKNSAKISTISQTPRIYLEVFVISLVIFIFLFSDLTQREVEVNVSFLAVLAFGAQKILPNINTIYNLSINFKGNVPSVVSFLNILDNSKYTNNAITHDETIISKLSFEKDIVIKDLSFSYDQNKSNILKNLNFKILKGEKICIKGKTGSGKSTLVNIICGLLHPKKGGVFVDGVKIEDKNLSNWQKNISIVPQSIFLNDASVSENIAIGEKNEKIDKIKLVDSAKKAQIFDFIKSLPNQFETKLGERGSRLSGGQKQRIGIARAIYRDPKLIILDEPTNALDANTEELVINSILNLGKNITIIMISHSNNLSAKFDKIINLDN